VNHVVCHGIPNDKRLKPGDIVNIDVTVIRDGFHGDTSRMYFVGKPPVQAERLVEVCFEAMWRGIRRCARAPTSATSAIAVQAYVEERGLLVVREYCGHGIGRDLPRGSAGAALRRPARAWTLRAGMTFTSSR
jgi:methionine aminopeptidase